MGKKKDTIFVLFYDFTLVLLYWVYIQVFGLIRLNHEM